jgi:hypothetical protein
MSKRILRTVLPLMAFILATAFAIARDQKPSGDNGQSEEYIFRNGQCELVTRGCNNLSSTPCTYTVNKVNYQVYAEDHTTYCSVPMTHQP